VGSRVAASGMQEIDSDEAEEQRQRRDDFKIDERLDADAAYFAEVTHARDAHHDGGEDDGREGHADELDEAVAERLEGNRGMGKERAEQSAEDNGDGDLQPERAEDGPGRGMLVGHGHSASRRMTAMRSALPSKPMPGNSGRVT
jgi:hypothetical protein